MSGAAPAAALLVLGAALLLLPEGGARGRRRLQAVRRGSAARTGHAARGRGGVRRAARPLRSDPATVLDLVAAALSAGLPPAQAVEVVAAALPAEDGQHLGEIAGRMRVGAATDQVWSEAPPTLTPLRRALSLSARTGAPAAELLTAEAEELRRRRRRAAETAAQRLGVRVVLPLGLCALPGFAAWGVVPVVLGLAADVLGR